MDEKAVKRRNWVKNIAIIFLALMLVLTLFSNTIMNYSLPQVAAQYCSNGTITTRIRANGTVEAKETYLVMAPTNMASAKIKAVGVKVGAAVTTDTVLFTLEDTQKQDIIEATQKLAELKEQYNTILKESGGDNSELMSQIQKQQEEIAKLQSSYYQGTAAEAVLKEMDKEKGEAERQNDINTDRLTEIKAKIKEIDDILNSNDDLQSSLAAAKSDFELKTAALQSAKDNLKAAEENSELTADALEKATDALDEYKASNSSSSITLEALTALREAYEKAKIAYQKAESAYLSENDALNELSKNCSAASIAASNAWQAYLNLSMNGSDSKEVVYSSDSDEKEAETTAGDTTATTEPIIIPETPSTIPNQNDSYAADKEAALQKFQTLQGEYENLVKSYNTAKAALTASWYDLESMKVALGYQKDELDRKEAEYKQGGNNTLKKLEEAKKTAEKNSKDAAKALENAKETLTTSQSQFDTAKSLYNLLKNADTESYAALLAEEEALTKATDEYQYTYVKSYSDFNVKYKDQESIFSSASKKSDVDAAADKLSELQKQLIDSQKTNSGATEVSTLKLDAKAKEIENQTALIEKIKAGDYTLDIYSPVEGVISAINVSAGNDVALNSTMAEIQIVDRGFVSSFKVTTDQAKRISVGSTADVSYWWGSSIKATVASVTPDPDSPNNSRIVKLELVGDVSVGTNLSFTIGEKSQSYESVIPNNAIREDNNGKFVLVVQAKATPLSTRYTAQRMNIEVIASDDTSSAVSGISYGDYVITTSSKPVTAGMQVRLNENG